MDTRSGLARDGLLGASTRRQAFKRTAAAAGAIALPAWLAACGDNDSGSGDGSANVVFATFGGDYEIAQKKAWFDPYMKRFPNVTITTDPAGDETKIPAMVESGNVAWDLIEVNYFGANAADNKSLVPIDCSVVPCSAYPRRRELALSHRNPDITYSMVLAYRSDELDGTPSGWTDFFDTKRFPGKRGIEKAPTDGVLELALIADGVDPTSLYPLDVERALRKLDTIRDDLVFWESGSQSADLLGGGEVVMQHMYNGRAGVLIDEGKPVEIQWNQNIQLFGFLVVLRGSKNVDQAMRLIGYISQPANNARISKYISYGPANPEGAPLVKAPDVDLLPSSHVEEAVPFNFAWWGANRAQVTERFQEWLNS